MSNAGGEVSDSVIVAAAEGSDWARARLLEAIAPQVRWMVRARLGPTPNQALAVEELADEVLWGLASGLGRLEIRTAAGLNSFLSTIVRNKVADYIRAGGARDGQVAIRSLDSTVASFSQVGPMWQFLSASGASPRTALDQAESLDRLMEELGRLDAAVREAIILSFFDRLSTAEIAEQMGRTRNEVSELVVRGIRALQDALVADVVGVDGGRAG
jgi:RNA polymerase sigma factor (sigma-70 family)